MNNTKSDQNVRMHRKICAFVARCSYTRVCPPVRGDNPRALAGGLSPRTGGQTLVKLLLIVFPDQIQMFTCIIQFPVRLSHLEHSKDNGENYLDPSGVGL